MQASKKAVLTLQDGTTFKGYSFGHEGPAAGEVVFNTAMTGYPESLTDPSYEGQILVTTFPQLGNYGVPPSGGEDTLQGHYEGARIHCRAIIAQDYAFHHSHWLADRSLAQWLRKKKFQASTASTPVPSPSISDSMAPCSAKSASKAVPK